MVFTGYSLAPTLVVGSNSAGSSFCRVWCMIRLMVGLEFNSREVGSWDVVRVVISDGKENWISTTQVALTPVLVSAEADVVQLILPALPTPIGRPRCAQYGCNEWCVVNCTWSTFSPSHVKILEEEFFDETLIMHIGGMGREGCSLLLPLRPPHLWSLSSTSDLRKRGPNAPTNYHGEAISLLPVPATWF